MRICLTLAFVLALATAAIAVDTGHRMPSKAPSTAPPNIPNPDRQGGDTIEDALMVVLPVVDMTGATTGYNDDYDEVCPYTGSTAPDVVYTFMAPGDMLVDVDMFGSTYDTKIYVYDEDLDLVACNDDFYPDYVSKIKAMPVVNGVQYFVVIDGYGGAFGDYVLNIDEFIPPPPCIVDCPAGAELEGEPPLVNDYIDNWNGGCNTEGVQPFQTIYSSAFCGVSGFYLSAGANTRDTDWFETMIPDYGLLTILGDAELATWLFELGPQDCGSVGVVQQVSLGPCIEGELVIVGDPGSTVWFWVGPQTFESPDGSDVYEYDYFLCIGYCNDLATEEHSWSDVKSLFR